jgi:uncharacterized cupin superfamily protein
MPQEAELIATEGGLAPGGDGWFVVSARDAEWWRHDVFGLSCGFESGEHRFPQFGINLHVLEPGRPNCMYHGESNQEDFLVLQGECLLLVEGEERRLRAWDFFHSPPHTEHVFVGAGDGPCLILMVGARREPEEIIYSAAEVARRHDAAVERDTPDPREAYARFSRWEPASAADRPELP